ncbi:MAG: hypothetical protein WDZ49_07695 [Litorilinea sp.]
MTDALSEVLTYIGVVVVGILVWAALSPFEVLSWWAGWFGDAIYGETIPTTTPNADSPPAASARAESPRPQAYIVFLSGVARVSGESFSYREQDFLRRLAVALPTAVIINDIFPYSVNNLPLTGQPFFARLWRFALRSKLSGPGLAGYLINLRNIWQVMISADKRYGPIFNQAVADVILHTLLRHGYALDQPTPIFVIGYSGAGQVSVGATMYLKEVLHAPVYVVSLGGVFASDPGVMAADRVFHIYGTRDRVHKSGLFAPGRWSIFPGSAWNRAKREGRVEMINVGPLGHTGAGGYLDAKRHLPNGIAFVDATVACIRKLVETQLALHTPE